MHPRRVVVADEQALFAELLSQALNELPSVRVVARTTDGGRLRELVREHRPDVVVIDTQLPPIDGFHAIRLIRQETPGTRVLAVGTFPSTEHLFETIRARLNGYVLKSGTVSEICSAVQAVVVGGTYFSPSLPNQALRALDSLLEHPNGRRRDALSEREREILSALARGSSTQQIATQSGISRKTVRNHISHMYQKLGISNRAGLVLYALRTGISGGG
jgi:DNA-binding NarL/FixJ family response regulator